MRNHTDQKSDQNVSIGFTVFIVIISIYLVLFKSMPFWLIFVLPIAGVILDSVFSTKKADKKVESTKDVQPAPTPQDDFKRRLGQQRAVLTGERYRKIDAAKAAKVDRSRPVTTFSVSKVGESNDYHYYDLPGEDCVGEIAEIVDDIQYGSNDHERSAYVVNVNGLSIGEVTPSTILKLEDVSDNYQDLTYKIESVKLDEYGESAKVKMGVYDVKDSNVARTWRMPLVGIPYNNRAKRLRACGTGTYNLKVTSYEGAPAVMILDPFGNDVGFVPKEHAAEVAKYYQDGRITRIRVVKIDPAPNGGLYADLELEILR